MVGERDGWMGNGTYGYVSEDETRIFFFFFLGL